MADETTENDELTTAEFQRAVLLLLSEMLDILRITADSLGKSNEFQESTGEAIETLAKTMGFEFDEEKEEAKA